MIYPSQVMERAARALGFLAEKADGAEDRFDDWLQEKTGHDWGEINLSFWRWPFLAAELRETRERAETVERAYEKLRALYRF